MDKRGDEYSSVTPNQFHGSDVERINEAITAVAGTGRRVVIPRRNRTADGEREIWLLDSAILLREDTVIELNNCHLKLTDNCRDNMMRSANCGKGKSDIEAISGIHIRGIGNVLLEGADRPRATGDGNKQLGERTFGTDAGVAGKSQTGDWRNIGIILAYVEKFSIEGIRMKDSHCWGISLERCAHGHLRDIEFASTETKMIDGVQETILNQDGIDLRLGCHDISIENISGYTDDDLIALTAIPHSGSGAGALDSTMVSGATPRGDGRDDIRHVTINNIKGHCRGGHNIIRFLNTSGARLHDVILDGLIDTSPPKVRSTAAVRIGDDAYGDGIAPIGDTSRVIVKDVISRAEHSIMIAGSLCDSIISDVIQQHAAGEAVTMGSGQEYVRNVTFANIHECGE